MPRNMSFMLTTNQVINKTKTVTRRDGWWFLKPGDIVNAVEKGMGLKKGEKVNVLCQIRILSTQRIGLGDINDSDLIAEGFPDMSADEFIAMFAESHGIERPTPDYPINRIEFEYL